MSTIELSDLGAAAEHLKRSDQHAASDPGRLEERMRELEAEGVVRRLGSGEPIPGEFYTDELPAVAAGSIVEDLIRARDEN